jgi:hypothetical protein
MLNKIVHFKSWLTSILIIAAFSLYPLLLTSSEALSERTQGIVIDHTCTKLSIIPAEWIVKARESLHIAYGHTSHGSQITSGMTGLAKWKGDRYSWNNGPKEGPLDLRAYYRNFGSLNIAHDLGDPNRTAWERATRIYLDQNPEINVVVWAWCWQVNGTKAEIDLYLKLMSQLEKDYPGVRFVYMTGRLIGQKKNDNVMLRNEQIRTYCKSNGKILYDFADIESYDPDGSYYGDKLANDACDYDSDGDGVRDRNWAVDWQNAHPGEWYQCQSAHSQPLNANLKAYAAWWLWARLAGWDGH